MNPPAELPVIAAIPNYNMGESLTELLPQVLRQGYDAVYVLDDHSTDSSRTIVARFAPGVVWIGGTHNLGAGGNRNRILEAHKAECIIHFLDADVRLLTNGIAAKARKLVDSYYIGFVGGLVLEKNGRQILWNYGPRFSLYADMTAVVQILFGNIQAKYPLWRRFIRILTVRARAEWPDLATEPKRQPVFWCVEANFFVLRSTFERIGGFDATLREHDSFDPALRAYKLGLVSYFDPSVAIKHLRIDVRGKGRVRVIHKAARYLIRKNGLREWLFPDGRFKPRYNG